jgi:hypothetical protein
MNQQQAEWAAAVEAELAKLRTSAEPRHLRYFMLVDETGTRALNLTMETPSEDTPHFEITRDFYHSCVVSEIEILHGVVRRKRSQTLVWSGPRAGHRWWSRADDPQIAVPDSWQGHKQGWDHARAS